MQLSYISTVVAPCADAVIAGLCPFRVSFFGDQVCLCHRPGCPIFLSDLWTGCHCTRYAGRGWNGLSHVEQLSFLTHRASLEVISAFWDVVEWCHRQDPCRLTAWSKKWLQCLDAIFQNNSVVMEIRFIHRSVNVRWETHRRHWSNRRVLVAVPVVDTSIVLMRWLQVEHVWDLESHSLGGDVRMLTCEVGAVLHRSPAHDDDFIILIIPFPPFPPTNKA